MAPARADVDPAKLSRWLPWIFLLDVLPGDDGPDFRYRLIGTAVDDLHGRYLTGQLISKAWPTRVADASLAVHRSAVDQRAPIRAVWNVRFPSQQFQMQTLTLPLSSDGATVDMLLGAAVYRGTDAGSDGAARRAAEWASVEADVQIFPLRP